jgi:hypothetical protein
MVYTYFMIKKDSVSNLGFFYLLFVEFVYYYCRQDLSNGYCLTLTSIEMLELPKHQQTNR